MTNIGKGFKKITLNDVKKISKDKKLKPCTVKGTTIVQLSNKITSRFEICDWDEFEKTLKNRGLAVYEYNGYMKIMKK